MVGFLSVDDGKIQMLGHCGAVASVEIVSSGQVLHIKAAGEFDLLSHSDVAIAVDCQVREYGKVCVLFEIHESRGRKAFALWQDQASNFKVRAIDSDNLEQEKTLLLHRVTGRGNDSRITES